MGRPGLNDLEANADGVIYVKSDGAKSTSASANDLYSVSWNVVRGNDRRNHLCCEV